MRWNPLLDTISLKIGEQRIGKKVRGKSPLQIYTKTDKISRTDCASRVGAIFDLGGRFAPLIAGFKLDLHDIKDISWTDDIPIDMIPK